jgi:hypothetical protein
MSFTFSKHSCPYSPCKRSCNRVSRELLNIQCSLLPLRRRKLWSCDVDPIATPQSIFQPTVGCSSYFLPIFLSKSTLRTTWNEFPKLHEPARHRDLPSICLSPSNTRGECRRPSNIYTLITLLPRFCIVVLQWPGAVMARLMTRWSML